MSMNIVTLLYLVASVFFIQALKGLSHPTTSLRGNLFGMVGMAIAVLTTGALIVETAGSNAGGMVYVLGALLVGGAAGTMMAKRVEMTKMPELVAFMHSMIGLAAVFIAVAAVAEPYAFGIVAKGEPIPAGNRLELFLGAAIGAITFSGSVIAFGKLSRQVQVPPVPGRAGVVSRPAQDQPGAGPADAGAGRGLHADRQLDGIFCHAGAVLRAWAC